VFREPADLITASTFSDPPLNVADVIKRDGRFVMDDATSWPAGERHADLPDGEYRLGFRSHHLSLGTGDDPAINLRGSVELAEISGSETFVHLNVGRHQWVSQSRGVHGIDVGRELTVSVNPDHFMMFAPDGRRVDGEA
jgi:glycerol transport system ATP-binding protein